MFLGADDLEAILRHTSLHFEGQNEQSPTAFDNLPSAFKTQAMSLITAFEIEITAIETVFKLSQNRDAESYKNIIRELKKQDSDARVIANEMEKRVKKLFPK
jgi:transcriptional regulator